MSLTVELPESVEKLLREKARVEGVTVELLAASLLTTVSDVTTQSEIPSELIDREYQAECDALLDASPSLQEIRKLLAAKIGERLTADLIAERDERF